MSFASVPAGLPQGAGGGPSSSPITPAVVKGVSLLELTGAYIYLSVGYSTVPGSRPAGLVDVYLPSSTSSAVAAAGFVAGVAAVSNPTVTVASTTGFAAADIIQVYNSTTNDGVYEVLAVVSATVLRIAGVGLTACTDDWTLTQFTSESGAGTVQKVGVTIIRTGADGVWEEGRGSEVPITFTNLVRAGDVATLLNSSATDRLIGRDTASAGALEELTVGGGVEFSGSGGIRRSALTGDVTASAGSGTTTIANSAVTLAKMADMATASLLGRNTAGTGVPEVLSAATARSLLGVTPTVRADILKVAGYTVTASDDQGVLIGDFTGNITLPAIASVAGRTFTLVQRSGVGTFVLDGSETILGGLTDLNPAAVVSVRLYAPSTGGATAWLPV